MGRGKCGYLDPVDHGRCSGLELDETEFEIGLDLGRPSEEYFHCPEEALLETGGSDERERFGSP